MITVVTGRFNTETLNSNYEYRKKYGFQCLYCCPWELSPKILYDTPVFVIEMNNQKNQIEGIGLIKNKYETNNNIITSTTGNIYMTYRSFSDISCIGLSISPNDFFIISICYFIIKG